MAQGTFWRGRIAGEALGVLLILVGLLTALSCLVLVAAGRLAAAFINSKLTPLFLDPFALCDGDVVWEGDLTDDLDDDWPDAG